MISVSALSTWQPLLHLSPVICLTSQHLLAGEGRTDVLQWHNACSSRSATILLMTCNVRESEDRPPLLAGRAARTDQIFVAPPPPSQSDGSLSWLEKSVLYNNSAELAQSNNFSTVIFKLNSKLSKQCTQPAFLSPSIWEQSQSLSKFPLVIAEILHVRHNKTIWWIAV